MIIAEDDFTRFRARARRSRLVARLTGRKDDLLSFEDVKRITAPTGESYIGCRSVPVEMIVGSEGRVNDFNRSFCPRREFLRHRWCRVDSAYYEGVTLPPVQHVAPAVADQLSARRVLRDLLRSIAVTIDGIACCARRMDRAVVRMKERAETPRDSTVF